MVLDTNTVLDWMVFEDAGVAAVAAAIRDGQLRWIACLPMRNELDRTLQYRSLAKWNPDSERVLSCFDRYAHLHPVAAVAPLNLRCSDPDDQVFLDLALGIGARWLLTHDRALLRLARRARAHGLVITQPRCWAPADEPA